jgi:hypothetical protein
MATQSLADVISEITPGNSEGQAVGDSWDTGIHGTTTLTHAPSGFSAVTGWGLVYLQAGATVSPSEATDTVQVEGFQTYVHLTKMGHG